jgi:integrase
MMTTACKKETMERRVARFPRRWSETVPTGKVRREMENYSYGNTNLSGEYQEELTKDVEPEREDVILTITIPPVVDGYKETTKRREAKEVSMFNSNGKPKAKAAEPIRDPEDILKLLNYFEERGEERNRLLVLMGISLCLRCGDLLSIRVGDVRNRDGSIKRKLELYEEKTNKFNSLPLTRDVREALDKYLNVMIEDEDYLFESKQRGQYGEKKPISISMVDIILKKAKKELGFDFNLSSHSFRKTGVYHMLKNNQYGRDGELTIQRMLNHSDFSTTLRYCGLMEDTLGEMKESMADAIFGSGHQKEE